MIYCKNCGYCEDQSQIHLHHIVPKCIGGLDIHGRIYLCKTCHKILHNLLPTVMWKFIPDKDKGPVMIELQRWTDWWIAKNGKKTNKSKL